MKKIYLSIIAATFAFSANAQLTLTKAFNEPVLGDVNTKETFDSVAVLNNSTGSNQVWDFSALTSSSVTEVSTFTTVASAPNGSSFTGATIAEDDGQGGFTFYKATATQYEIVGIDNSNITLNFSSNTAIAAIWPVTMGYSNTDVFSGSAAIQTTLTGTADGTVTTMGSGTGTLIIPGSTSFTNILQVKTIQNVELSLAGGFFTATVQTTDYNYYHGTQKFPLLTVSYTDGQGTIPNSATIKINSAVILGINDLNFDATFNVFPNPAKDVVNVKLQNVTNADCKIQIVNSIGQIAQEIDLGNDSEITRNISVSHLNSGIYMVKTTLGNKVSVRKLIVE